MASALGWGVLAASSLVLGALLAIVRKWSDRSVGVVLAFGAGALISAVSFELAQEGVKVGGQVSVAIGLAVGAVVYFTLNRMVKGGGGASLALGAFLDGIPEQMVLGIGLAGGASVSIGLIVAIFVSNIPEATGSSSELVAHGHSRGKVLGLWGAVAVICTLATVLGYAIADAAGGHGRAGINGFAAGALLVMLVDTMVPDATKKSGQLAGLVTVLGFAVGAGLSAT
jgi:ZIP family zinc transporter